MIKRLLVLATITFAIAFAAVPKVSAAACTAGNYSAYFVPGFSCQIDGLNFSNFSFNAAGNNPITPSSIGVVPITTPGNQGFNFNPGIILAGTNQTADVALDFDVTAMNGFLTDLGISFNGSVFGTGATSFSETVTGATFPGAPTISVTNPPAGNSGPLNVVFTTPVTTIHVVKDIGANTGANGEASISQVINTFSNTVPEPATLTLLSIGLTGLLAFGVRRKS